jgi:hypothetical protein
VKVSTGPESQLRASANNKGHMTDIKKALDSTYLRGQVIALYKLKNNIDKTITKLEEEIKDSENERNNI